MNPAAVGVATEAMLMYASGLNVADCGTGNPGEARGCLLNVEAVGDEKGFTIVPVGDSGSFKFNGVGPFGNSHCVDCEGRWM